MTRGTYRTCGECGHTFATARDFLEEHNRMTADLLAPQWETPGSWHTTQTYDVAEPVTDPANMTACPRYGHNWQ